MRLRCFWRLAAIYLLSGAGLLAAAVYLYVSDYIRSGNLLHLRGIFALSFVVDRDWRV